MNYGGKVDISCSNVEKNGGEQWVSHATSTPARTTARCWRTAELLAPSIYGRTENRSMRLVLKAAAAEEIEEQRAAAVVADASAASRSSQGAAAGSVDRCAAGSGDQEMLARAGGVEQEACVAVCDGRDRRR